MGAGGSLLSGTLFIAQGSNPWPDSMTKNQNLALILTGLIALVSLGGVIALALASMDVPEILIITLSSSLGAIAGAVTLQRETLSVK